VLQQGQVLLNQPFRARRQAPFLDEMRLPVRLPTRLTTVPLGRSLYRAALEGCLKFRGSAVVRLEDSRLRCRRRFSPDDAEDGRHREGPRATVFAGL
jgi:hypothetical protein